MENDEGEPSFEMSFPRKTRGEVGSEVNFQGKKGEASLPGKTQGEVSFELSFQRKMRGEVGFEVSLRGKCWVK